MKDKEKSVLQPAINYPATDQLSDSDYKEGDKSGSMISDDYQGCYMPKRYITILLLFVGMVIVHAQRVNVGVTVVSILDKSHHNGPAVEMGKGSVMALSQLHWTSHMVGWLHSVFYVGLLISQVPCGYLVTKYPSHRLFGGCCLATFVLNFFIPLSISRLGYGMTCFVRLLQGLVEGLLYPSCYDVLRHWTLPEERSRMGSSVLTGSYIGPTLGMVFSGLLTFYLGWQYVFYVHGGVGLLWYILWFLLAFESPALHPTITGYEKRKIEEQQGESAVQYENDQIPWKEIFMSLPVYALIVCNFARSFVFYMLLTNQPSYLNIFKFSIAENGLFASLPHAFMALFCVLSGTVADYLWTQPWLSATAIRKLFTCLGFGIEALFFFGLALVTDRSVAVAFLTAGVGISGIAISGWQINHLDLAPRYAGVLVAITMTVGTLAGVTNPIIVAAMTEDTTLTSWQNVFWLTGIVLAVATAFYGLFGSGDRQHWSTPRPSGGAIIVSKSGDLLGRRNSKPYGTFHAQYNDPPPADLLQPSKSFHDHDDEIDNDKLSSSSSPTSSHHRPSHDVQRAHDEPLPSQKVERRDGLSSPQYEEEKDSLAHQETDKRMAKQKSSSTSGKEKLIPADNGKDALIPLMNLTMAQPQPTLPPSNTYPPNQAMNSPANSIYTDRDSTIKPRNLNRKSSHSGKRRSVEHSDDNIMKNGYKRSSYD